MDAQWSRFLSLSSAVPKVVFLVMLGILLSYSLKQSEAIVVDHITVKSVFDGQRFIAVHQVLAILAQSLIDHYRHIQQDPAHHTPI